MKYINLCFLLFLAGCTGGGSDTNVKNDTANQDAKESFEWGVYWYNNKDFDRAITKFSDALDESPDYIEAMISAANAFRERGNLRFIRNVNIANDDHETARLLLIKAEALDKDNLEIKYSFGLLFFQKANIPEKVFTEEERRSFRDKAIGYFQEVLTAKPDDFQSHRYLGISLLEKADLEGAKRHLNIYLNHAREELAKWQSMQPKTDNDRMAKLQQTTFWQDEVYNINDLLKDVEKAVDRAIK